MFSNLQRVRTNLIDSIILLSYRMRGGITYYEFMNMSYYERQAVSIFLEEHKEITGL